MTPTANEKFVRTKLPRHPAVWWSRIKYRWPALTWVAGVILAIFFYFHGARFGSMTGVADTVSQDVAPVEAARLLRVLVVPGQKVKKGDVVAELDPALVLAEMAVQNALYAEASRSIDTYQQDMLQMERQFSEAVETAESTLLSEQTIQAAALAELKVLAQEADRMRKLLEAGGVTAADAALVLARYESLTKSAEFYPQTIKTYEAQAQQARDRYAAYHRWLQSASEGSMQKAIEEKQRLHLEAVKTEADLIEARLRSYQLLTVIDGTVSQVLHDPGDIVASADPIVRIVQEEVTRVRGFVPESNAHEVRQGMRAYVSRHNGRGRVHNGHVTIVEPEILALPTRVSPVPNQTSRGRRIHLDLDTPTRELVPGETVRIHLVAPIFQMLFGRSETQEPQPGAASPES